MAKTPIEIYKEVLKDLAVKDNENAPPVGKISYVQDQLQQQRAYLNRLLFDIATAKFHQDLANDEDLKAAHRKKADGFEGDARQTLSAIRVNIQLIDQLREEYPELQVG